MSKQAPKITAKTIADIETTTIKALQAVTEAEEGAEAVKSDAYALFATAVLLQTGNIKGDRKGTATRSAIAETAKNAGYRYSKGTLSKAETVLSVKVAEVFGEQENYTAEQYAEAYDLIKAEGLTIFSAYDAQNGGDEDGEGEGEDKSGWSLEQALATVFAKARKEGIADEDVLAEAQRQAKIGGE